MNVNEIIDYIKEMNEKDKLKLAIQVNQTTYTNSDYDKRILFNKFDTRLKEIDSEYRNNFSIPKHLLMVTAWITELSKKEQNKVELYLCNILKNLCLQCF